MSLLTEASLIVTPNGYNVGKLYSVIPNTTLGDMDVSRATTATRVNSAGLIELMPINVPRLDYTLGSCPSILVEPLRTNLVLQSQTLDNASWTKLPTGTGIAPVVTANQGTAPDGTMTAERVQFNCVGNLSADRSILLQGSLVTTIATRYYQSIYVKAFSSGEVGKQLRIAADGLNIPNTVITITADWQRIVLNGLANATTTNFIVETRGTFTTPTNTTADVLLWGAQMEAGSNATSYIPTTTLIAGTTRNADVISKTGIISLIGQTEGTLFLDAKYLASATSSGRWFKLFGVSNEIGLALNGVNSVRAIINGLSDTITTSPKTDLGIKIAFAYNATGVVLFINGTQYALPLGGAQIMTSLDSIIFDAAVNPQFQQGEVNSFILFKTRLTDDQCILLTGASFSSYPEMANALIYTIQ